MDCRSMPESCHENAKCKKTGIKYEPEPGFSYNAAACVCKNGYLGNGFLCVKEPNDCTTTCCVGEDSSLQIEKDFCNFISHFLWNEEKNLSEGIQKRKFCKDAHFFFLFSVTNPPSELGRK